MNFQKYAQDGEAFVNEVARELGCPDDQKKAARILRATLHAFREQSTPEEMMQFIAQLPMFIKAVFVDGWRIGAKHKHVRNLDEFAERVRESDTTHGAQDFGTQTETFAAIRAVFQVLQAHVSDGELEDIWRTLPEGLQPLLT